MTITVNNYLDLGNLLINELFGDVYLFLIVGCIFITWYAIKQRIPLQAIITIDFIFIAATMTYQYLPSVWVFAVFIIGLLIYIIYDKYFRR